MSSSFATSSSASPESSPRSSESALRRGPRSQRDTAPSSTEAAGAPSQPGEHVHRPAGEAGDRRKVVPASFGQAGLWFLRQVMPCKSAYNTAVQLRLSGELDAPLIEAAFREIVRRHESLRTTFTLRDGSIFQVIEEGRAADVSVVDLVASADPEAETARLALAAAAEPFDLERGPLLRVRIFRLGPRDHALLLVLDHIVGDGMSLGILWRELEALYVAARAGEPPRLAAPRRQFAECVEAQNAWMRTPGFARQLAYWKDHLTGAAGCDLPVDRTRPPVKSFRGGLEALSIPKDVVDRLRAISARAEVSLFAVLLSAVDVLFARMSGQSDIVVMIPVACRQRYDADDVVGFFANMVVLRTEVVDRMPIGELLQRVNKEIMGGVFRQDVPFDKVIEAIRPERSLSRDPLAQLAMSFLPAHGSALSLPGVESVYSQVPNGGAKFDLHLTLTEHADHIGCTAEYNEDVFDAETIARLLGHYRVLLDAIADGATSAVADLPLLTPEDQRRALVEWNETRAPLPSDASIPTLVAETVARTPDVIAASFDDREISYADLDRASNRIAHCLRARGAGPGALVGISVDRSLDMLAALLGILKTGAAYVPLDPGYPRDRVAFMAEDARLRALVTQEQYVERFEATEKRSILCLDADAGEIAAASDAPLGQAIDPSAIAYVIYTSGSTGRPKGVEVPHRAVVNFLRSMAERPGLGPSDRILALTSLSFDIAGLEMWLPLSVGARVDIVSREVAADGVALRSRLEALGTTVIQATPSTFRLLLEAAWLAYDGGSPGEPGSAPKPPRGDHVRVLVGGEAVPRELSDKLLERVGAVWNMYGPTETTIWSCIHPLEKGAPVLIGRPIANTQTYVLDSRLAPVPIGVAGELFIAGDGVARGYLGQPELTARKFVPDPFSSTPGARMYRTGDVCRHRPDGSLEFIGRADFQVKVRGYRVELGEIETMLAEHASIREAVVVVYEKTPGDQKLVAYVTTRPDALEGAALVTDLRAHLRTKLPEYMVPSHFVRLERLPLTANNKINRAVLPPPADTPIAASGDDASPREALELKLHGIWSEVLGVKGIGRRESFFDLGGHSLLALKLFDRVERSFGMKLPVASIFEASTIERMGAMLRAGGWEPKWTSLVPIQPGGSKPPFFCVHGGGAHVLFYYPMAKLLGPDQPFYGLQPAALSVNDINHPDNRSVEAMAAHYLDEIRDIQPTGPYYLGGASYGGMIALEMAQQLAAKGERAAIVAMFDTYGPGYYTPPGFFKRIQLSPISLYLTLEHHFGSVMMLDPNERVPYVLSKLTKAAEEASESFDTWKREVARGVFTRIGRPLPHELEEVRNAVNEALARYRPRAYEGPITLFRARRQAPGVNGDPTLGWGSIARGGLEIHHIPGYHAAMISQPRVRHLLPKLEACLARARERA